MNPSAEDFLEAFSRINADVLLVFPNNGNVVLAARQAAQLYEGAEVRVVETKTIGEGYAAISMLDTSCGDTEAILDSLREIIDGVVTGHVSPASREALMDGVSVRPGDFIGFARDRIYVDDPDRASAVLRLAEALEADRFDILLLVAGQDAPPAEAEALLAALKKQFPRLEVILQQGDQPVYDYILILE